MECDSCSLGFPAGLRQHLYEHWLRGHANSASELAAKRSLVEAVRERRLSRQHPPAKPTFLCDSCKYNTQYSKSLLNHFSRIHGLILQDRRQSEEQLSRCDDCCASNESKRTIRQHILRAHTVEQPNMTAKRIAIVTCDICGWKGAKGTLSRSHWTFYHASSIMVRKKPRNKQTFACEECGKTSLTHPLMVDHVARHRNPKAYARCSLRYKVCDDCGEARKKLAKHWLTNHANLSMGRLLTLRSDQSAQHVSCDACSATMHRSRFMSHHIKHASDQSVRIRLREKYRMKRKPYRSKNVLCDGCGKAFGGKKELNKHQKMTQKV